MKKKYHLRIPSQTENLEIIREFVTKIARKVGFRDEETGKIELAVDEACTNVIEHAYGGEDKGDIEASVRIERGGLTITLVDHGKPFDPASVPEPTIIADDPSKIKTGGLGLHLMRKVMDEVTFSFGDGRNTLVMVKRQPVQPESKR
jgi:serine/threonine-protein kinase RsbW